MESLSDAQVLLLAAQLTSTLELHELRGLVAKRQDVLVQPIVFRILFTYLPLDLDDEVEKALVNLLRDIDEQFINFSELDEDLANDIDITNISQAESSLSKLRLLGVPTYLADDEPDLLCDFLIAWFHKLDQFGTISDTILNLIAAFESQHAALRAWADTYLRPLYKLQNRFYPERAISLSLTDVESNHGLAGVDMFLRFSTESGVPTNIVRDVNEVVAPWVTGAMRAKRRKIDLHSRGNKSPASITWSDVNEWLLLTSQKNFQAAAATVEQWNGPPSDAAKEAQTNLPQGLDVQIAYIQTVLAMIYVSDGRDDSSRISTKNGLLARASHLAQLMSPDLTTPLPDIPDTSSLKTCSKTDLLDNTLLLPNNPLTRPSTNVVDFLHGALYTQILLDGLKIHSSTKEIASMVLFGSLEQQKQELQKIIDQVPKLTRSNLSWHEVRSQILWLHAWSNSPTTSETRPLAYLGRVCVESMEFAILDAMLISGEYESVKNIYISPDQQILSADTIEARILQATYNAYDNASNGNRTRGGVKRAFDILKAFSPLFPSSHQFSTIEHLIKATHSLSFYQLTLQHGVPFQPVSIRVSSDPLSLIGSVLEQNPKAYTKLDDLLAVARDLVLADLPMPDTSAEFAPGDSVPLDRRLFDAEHRVTFLAVTAALNDHDFDTAYSLITTRLSNSRSTSSNSFADDTTWRAAYAAGKYRSHQTPPNLHAQIAFLKKQMDLIATALTLAPTSESLPEILSTWRRCEEEMDSLKAQALSEERSRDTSIDNDLPGGFGSSDREMDADETKRLVESRRAQNAALPSYEEEAPLGLFDVARGAASALRKNAFPLQSAGAINIQVGSQARKSLDEDMTSSTELQRPGSSDGQRVRKRDMISNAVTGTVVGGLSWVLGAQPADQRQQP